MILIVLATVNLAAALWLIAHFSLPSGTAFLAIIVGIAVSAVTERWRFGRESGWRARFDPIVVVSFMLTFDLFLGAAVLARRFAA